MRKLLVLALLSLGLVGGLGDASSGAGEIEEEVRWQAVEVDSGAEDDIKPVRVEDPNPMCLAPSTMCYPGQKENRDISTGCCYFTCSDQREYVLTAFTPGVACP
jgi:hypothetical protein